LIPSMIVYSMLNPQVFFKNQAKIAVALILMVFLLPFFAFQLGFVSGEIDLSFDGIKTLSQGLMNRLSWEKIFEFEAKFSFLEFLGIIPFILAVIGLSSIIVLKILSMLKPSHSLVEEFFKNRHLFFLPAMALTLLALYAQFHLTGRVLFAPYERQFMAASFILLMLAGIALYYLVELMKKIFLNLGIFSAKFFRLAFLGMLSVFFISLLTISNFEFAGEFYQNASASDLSAVEWIESFNAEKNYVIALPWHSRIIKFLAEKKVYATSNARAAEGVKENLLNFFLLSCEEKIAFIETEHPELLVSNTDQPCDYWNKVYDKKNLGAYTFN